MWGERKPTLSAPQRVNVCFSAWQEKVTKTRRTCTTQDKLLISSHVLHIFGDALSSYQCIRLGGDVVSVALERHYNGTLSKVTLLFSASQSFSSISFAWFLFAERRETVVKLCNYVNSDNSSST